VPERIHDHAELADRIARAVQHRARPIVVAIDGRSGSGKSTLAAALAQTLGAAVIEGDDFYAGGTGLRDDSPASRVSACIDWSAQRTVLEALLAGKAARWHPFDWVAFDGTRSALPSLLGPRQVILLEGTYSARPELADLLGLRILVTVSDAEREDRLLEREGNIDAWERQWHEAEEHYFGAIMPVDHFDILVSG
jgi:uridine kinase